MPFPPGSMLCGSALHDLGAIALGYRPLVRKAPKPLAEWAPGGPAGLSLIHISERTRLALI
eukprot:1317827-Alexandrium_andersonii.AAC.1